MDVQIFSDLHFESNLFPVVKDDIVGDVLVFAGDIHTSPKHVVPLLADLANERPVVYVLGNHEYYGHTWDKAVDDYKEQVAKNGIRNIHILDEESVVVDGVRFLGATLWTDFFGEKRKVGEACENALADYSRIFKTDDILTWKDVFYRHRQNKKWLQTELEKGFSGPTVVVTHHAPSPLSIHQRFLGSEINGGFVSNLEDIIVKHQPNLWIHGHTHDSFNYRIEKTRIVCNPHGYDIENSRFFNRNCVVNI